MASILNRTEPNTESKQVFIITWLFPITFFFLSTVSLCIASDARRFFKSCRLNQWNALWVIPFLLLGVSWRFFGSWTLVFSLFYWPYIFIHMASLLLGRQSSEKPVPLGIEDFLVLFIGLSALTIWQLKAISSAGLIATFANALCMALITIICALLAETYSNNNFSGTAWQRAFLILVSFSVPVSMVFSKITSAQILALAISCWLFFSDSTNKKLLIVSHLLASLIFILTPMIFPEGVIITLWICILAILKNRKNEKFEGILVPGGAIIFFLIGFFIAVVRMKGQVLTGDIVYSFPAVTDWFGFLFDRSKGLIPVAPWVLTVIAGWLLAYPERKLDQWVQWLGFPFILAGFMVFEWMNHGKPPGWNHWLMMVPVVFPYYGALWSKPINSLTGSIIRVVNSIGIFISSILFVYSRFSGLDSVNLTETLADFSQRTGIELSRLVPVFDHALPGYSKIHWIWIGSSVVFILLLVSIVHIPRKASQNIKPGLMDTVFIAGTIGLMGLCFQTSQIWRIVPLEKDIHLGPGQTVQIENKFKGNVYAVKIISDLSHSTHLPQRYAVAELILETPEGVTQKQELQAGIHTAEWAFNRPDVRRDIQHRRPKPAWSWDVEEIDGSKFSGMTYESIFYLDKPQKISHIIAQNIETKEKGHVLTIRGLALMVRSDRNTWREAQQLIEVPLIMSEDTNIQSFKLQGDSSYKQISLDSALANAMIVPTGAPVGSITIKNKDKSELSWIIKAGIDTAEWSADRPDIAGKVRHDLPTIAYSERRSHHSINYLAHVYRSRRVFDKEFFPIEISIEYLPSENELPNGEWIVHGLALR